MEKKGPNVVALFWLLFLILLIIAILMAASSMSLVPSWNAPLKFAAVVALLLVFTVPGAMAAVQVGSEGLRQLSPVFATKLSKLPFAGDFFGSFKMTYRLDLAIPMSLAMLLGLEAILIALGLNFLDEKKFEKKLEAENRNSLSPSPKATTTTTTSPLISNNNSNNNGNNWLSSHHPEEINGKILKYLACIALFCDAVIMFLGCSSSGAGVLSSSGLPPIFAPLVITAIYLCLLIFSAWIHVRLYLALR